jgi:antitoxin HicB
VVSSVGVSPAYSMRVYWSNEDTAFVAVCPELPTLLAFGDTYQEAVNELQDAIAGALEIYSENGWALPEPNQDTDFSGQFRVRLPRSLHASLASEAERDGISLNTYIVNRLSAANAAHQEARVVIESVEKSLNRLSNQMDGLTTSSPFPRRPSKSIDAETRNLLAHPIGVLKGKA